MLEMLDYTIRIGSTPTFLYFDTILFGTNTHRANGGWLHSHLNQSYKIICVLLKNRSALKQEGYEKRKWLILIIVLVRSTIRLTEAAAEMF